MDILERCQKWHEEDKFQKIIDALEAIPAQARTPEMDSELARAYNNLATPEDRELYQKALSLLKPHADYFAEDHCWNFRMGYSYYFLDQEGRALPYFRKALEKLPGDEDTQELIDDCERRITLPQFTACFRERTENWWETFAEMEGSLRQMMDDDKDHTRGAELVAQMEETLNLVFDEISFEMGFNGEKHELILTPEGDKVKLFELIYFQKHAPKEVLEHWNILVGRQPSPNTGLRTEDGWDISGEDVQIWLEEQSENSFAITAYCEKLLPMLCLLYTSPQPGTPCLSDRLSQRRPAGKADGKSEKDAGRPSPHLYENRKEPGADREAAEENAGGMRMEQKSDGNRAGTDHIHGRCSTGCERRTTITFNRKGAPLWHYKTRK